MEKHKPKESWQEPVAESEELGKEENENDAITWDEFIQNTTIHGVRYIFNDSRRIRRFEKAVSDPVRRRQGGRRPLLLLFTLPF